MCRTDDNNQRANANGNNYSSNQHNGNSRRTGRHPNVGNGQGGSNRQTGGNGRGNGERFNVGNGQGGSNRQTGGNGRGNGGRTNVGDGQIGGNLHNGDQNNDNNNRFEYVQDNTISFVNPYNFVPTTEPVRGEEGNGNGAQKHTGYFTCRLITKTPLAISDVAAAINNENNNDARSYPFMLLDRKNPMIPGSSIRGVIRNIYETVTNSCMITVAGDDVITARTDTRNAFAPGLLIKNEDSNIWELYSAERVPLVVWEDVPKTVIDGNKYKLHKYISGDYTSFKNYQYSCGASYQWNGSIKIKRDNNTNEFDEYIWGEKVWVDKSGVGHKKNGRKVWSCSAKGIKKYNCYQNSAPTGGYVEGYLYLGEAISNKHAEGVFIKNGGEAIASGDELIKKLDKIHNDYNSTAINRNLHKSLGGSVSLGDKIKPHYGYQGYEKAKENGVIPMWYKKEEQNGRARVYVSLAAIGRKSYYNTLSNIGNVGKPCSDRMNVCKACALFGMVGESSRGSKVRFTDAECTVNNGMVGNNDNYVLLKELSSPKPSYLPFYTVDARDYDDNGINIRGRKFYWHNPMVNGNDGDGFYKGDENNASRSARLKLLNTGSEFKFNVYFDGITDEQLQELAWSLTLGENNKNSNQCIKLGHGKPLGLGSAKVVIEKVVERVVELDRGEYKIHDCIISGDCSKKIVDIIQEENDCLERKANNEEFRAIYNALKTISNFMAMDGMDVKYPYIIDARPDNGGQNGANANGTNNDKLASFQWFAKNTGSLPDICYSENNPLHPYRYGVENNHQIAAQTAYRDAGAANTAMGDLLREIKINN